MFRYFGLKDGIWYSIFHSITAFCNAGFDLFGTNSFIGFANNAYVNIVVITLMLMGGIGFFVIEDIITCIKKKSFVHMQFHTKIVLITTFVLYFLSVIMIKIVQPDLSILQILFISSSTRTTGFTTIDLTKVNSLTKLLFSILMMIGGAPASTSGGIKITSIAVLVLIVYATLNDRKEVTAFFKKIDTQTIRHAITNIAVSTAVVFGAVIIFYKIENIGLINVLFMCVSAFSLTGLSVVDVDLLCLASKFILMALMFVGRVGVFSILGIFIAGKKENRDAQYVAGNIVV